MDIKEQHIYRGRNIYCHKPVIKLLVDAGALSDIPTKDLSGFNEQLLSNFPGLKKHYCSLGYEGGFVTRLKEGTYVCHVAEHLTLELQSMAGFDVYFGKTRWAENPSLYHIIYEYMDEEIGLACGYAAVEIISCLAHNESVSTKAQLEKIKRLAAETALGPSTKAIYQAAEKRKIPVRRLGHESLLQLSYGNKMRLIQASLPDGTSCLATDIAKNKDLTKQMLGAYGIPVPEGRIVYDEEEALATGKALGYPLALKPFDGNQGRGVSLNIRDENQLRSAYRAAAKYSTALIVERFISGNDFRVLVVGDRVVAASERKPPFVTGDGIHSIKELVHRENRNVQRGVGHEKPLTKIKLDHVAKHFLHKNGLSENDIPGKSEVIALRENGNISTGGTARDCTAEVHPVNQEIAVRAAKIIGLEIAGIDFVMADIARPLQEGKGAIVEVNAGPGLRMHLFPTFGSSRDVGQEIIDFLYPQGEDVTIPIISVTGTNGKTTVTRLLKHVLSLTGKRVGMTCTQGTYIGGKCISMGDNTGPMSAQLVLSNREVEAAVLETARGGIVRRGLGYDLADVGVIINVSDDHRGQDGIDTLEDLAFAKSLVIEAIKPGGCAVLNADDPMTPYFAKRIHGKIIYFSQNHDNDLIKNHVQKGGQAVMVMDQMIVLDQDGKKIPLISVPEIPITFGGSSKCNIENALAAVSALYALNISEHIIAMGLRSFHPDVNTNPGRFNLFDLGDCKVMLDYGHNISAYEAVGQLIPYIGTERAVGIIGMPGDRMDENIIEAGKIAGRVFSKIYIREDRDLRQRAPGEVAHLLYQGIMEGGGDEGEISVVPSETESLQIAVEEALPGDLIVLFYENFQHVFDILQKLIEKRSDMSEDFMPDKSRINEINFIPPQLEQGNPYLSAHPS
ncbi:cyanophycin synthetase [Dehalobacterium formicoaceticum]|uniref:Cyanophycin synthetase n=1 Tax=Dehalobacterium formicoaceticum TaxID=51515 RepID=A0ABT1Y5Z3_9FIRM|nr:cyanophycin synthetase [Dehalobacterium formicoaceticum]MCR6546300.1 cyanophycin synthetase [Dehalobacterium formicoaceticum]